MPGNKRLATENRASGSLSRSFHRLRITTSAVPARINPHPTIIKVVTISPRNSPAQIIVKAGIKNVTVRDLVGPISAIKRKYNKNATPLLNNANKIIFTAIKTVTGPGSGANGVNGSNNRLAIN